jgi:hypothetical protein
MKSGKNIRGALSYNEAKVRAGKAELILASRYGCDANELSFSQKLKRFTDLNEKCVTSSFNAVHISLNFSPGDSVDTEKMQLIAREYMQQLGFEKQPYLVYRHNDTAHPHLHIVTTPVKANGRTINLHNLVQRKSEPARKSIEEEYNLIKAEGRTQAEGMSPIKWEALQYGKAETKQAVSQIVRSVADTWKFTTFDEYNLILRQYGITADRGEENTKIRKHGGLRYFIINDSGKKISVGIKASSIYTSPTLKNIEKKFAANKFKKSTSIQYTTASVQYTLQNAKSVNEFIRSLSDKKIAVVISNGQYRFIDYRKKTVTTSQELGILPDGFNKLNNTPLDSSRLDLTLLQKLFENEYTGPDLAAAFLKKKRKKKK